MAPEQANGRPVDARADVYALGLVLWESLVGNHVRPADERMVTLAIARSGELPEVPGTIPPPLADVIRRATALDPEARFATAREMAEALDAFMIVERVREGGQAPAKRLAEWLAARWGDDRGENADADAVPEGGGAIVTFLDDGEEGIRGGAHTQRSVAETAAEEEPAAPSPEAPSPPAQRTRAGTLPPPPAQRARAGTLPPPPPVQLPEDDDSPARLLLPSNRHAQLDPWSPPESAEAKVDTAPIGGRRRWLVAIPLAIAALAGVYVLGWRRGAHPPADAQVALAAFDAASAPAPDAEPPPDAEPTPADAEPAPDAARLPIDAAIVRVVPRIDGGAGGTSAVLRPIWVNALPWAFFTVDADPKQHETPAMLKLSVGDHRVTFTNPQLGVSRTVTVTVPAQGEARHVEKMN
jgi:hypothetical protein